MILWFYRRLLRGVKTFQFNTIGFSLWFFFCGCVEKNGRKKKGEERFFFFIIFPKPHSTQNSLKLGRFQLNKMFYAKATCFTGSLKRRRIFFFFFFVFVTQWNAIYSAFEKKFLTPGANKTSKSCILLTRNFNALPLIIPKKLLLLSKKYSIKMSATDSRWKRTQN